MNKKIKLLAVVGARPNFMKIAPLIKVARKFDNIELKIVHTNQHDIKVSDVFFKDLDIGDPHHTLNKTWETTLEMIGGIIHQLEKIVLAEKPDMMIVVGDVTSTLAAALTANKCGIKLAHIESGLRSFDRSMPEEINRIITDELSDLLFATEESAIKNLKSASGKVFLVGNVMIDNLINNLSKIDDDSHKKHGLAKKEYVVFTAHRPSNVDTEDGLLKIYDILNKMHDDTGFKIVFPIHPRTESNLKKFKLYGKFSELKNLKLIEPLDYKSFIGLVRHSAAVVTDSGGIQEETAYLKIPTVTLRTSTERPSTIECGSNKLVPPYLHADTIVAEIKKALEVEKDVIKEVPLNDGKAGERILAIILDHLKAWEKSNTKTA